MNFPNANSSASSPQRVVLYSQVEIELTNRQGEQERLSFYIVTDDQANFYAGYLGENTPLAKAILGKPVGKTVAYHAGDIELVKVLSIKPGEFNVKEMAKRAAEKRKEDLEKSILQMDRTNAILFSTTIEGKWGEYDPDGVEHWDKQQDTKSDE